MSSAMVSKKKWKTYIFGIPNLEVRRGWMILYPLINGFVINFLMQWSVYLLPSSYFCCLNHLGVGYPLVFTYSWHSEEIWRDMSAFSLSEQPAQPNQRWKNRLLVVKSLPRFRKHGMFELSWEGEGQTRKRCPRHKLHLHTWFLEHAF